MRILRREEDWIHTHFVTDCVYLSEANARAVRTEMAKFLDEIGIVFGIRHRKPERPERGGLRIVLECIPLPAVMERIQNRLKDVVKDIPSRPRKTTVAVQPPGSAPSSTSTPRQRVRR